MPTRLSYNEFRETDYPEFVKRLLSDCETTGVFETGIESGRRGRWCALNTDVYGWEAAQELAVIQVRQSEKTKYGVTVKKDYYLIGRNEDGALFTHPIESPVRSSFAMGEPEDCVAFVQAKIWGVTLRQLATVKRHGDIGFLPVKNPAGEMLGTRMECRASHRIFASAIYSDGESVWAVNPIATHTRHQHADLQLAGVFKVILGARAEHWGFTRPVVD